MSVFCCGGIQPSIIYNLPAVNCIWKRYYFLNECTYCGQSIGILRIKSKSGRVKDIKRYRGLKAVQYRNKIIKQNYIFKVPAGSLADERTYYNNRGIIYNFNNRKVGKNEDFIKIQDSGQRRSGKSRQASKSVVF